MKKKFLCLILALVMLLSLVACGGNNNDTPSTTDPAPTTDDNTPAPDTQEPAEPEGFQPYTYDDETVYMNALSEFYDYVLAAKDNTDVDQMYAEMALAEAKLMESGTFLPLNGDGGSYGITRVAPYTIPTTMWGSDSDRYETYVITTELITKADRDHLAAKWGELRGTGEYEQYAKDYLVGQGYTLSNEYRYNGYSSDPETWDTLSAWTNSVSEPICVTVDSLIKYDMENVIQPALAESWEMSEDGLTWTFHLRDAVWTDSQAREVAKVQADDWVAAAQHLLDFYGDSAGEVFAPILVNGMEYVNGEVTDFSQVGVEALDEKTLVYHLTRPVPAFLSMFSYCGMGAPLCRSYYESQGGTFGPDHDNGNYGTGPNNILYCGPYVISSFTSKNSFVFDANPTYWNLENMNVTRMVWPYVDGTDPLRSYNDTISGAFTGCGLGTSALIKCREDGYFDEYARLSSLNGTSRMGFANLNRQMFTLYNDPSAGISPQTHESVDSIDRLNGVVLADASMEDVAARTHVAINNQNFRLAVAFALDRAGYNAQSVGDELKYVALRNSYVPANFVSIEKDVTVDINGTATTFEAGTYYGAIMQAQIDADGYPIKVWDPDADSGNGSGDGFDGWYNVDNARAYMADAVEELAAQGLEISAENPIYIDFYYGGYNETFTNRANAYKQSIEASLEGLVQVNLISVEDSSQLNSTNFYPTTGAEVTGDYSLGTGWTADYADPASFLDNCLPYGDGYQTKNLGLW